MQSHNSQRGRLFEGLLGIENGGYYHSKRPINSQPWHWFGEQIHNLCISILPGHMNNSCRLGFPCSVGCYCVMSSLILTLLHSWLTSYYLDHVNIYFHRAELGIKHRRLHCTLLAFLVSANVSVLWSQRQTHLRHHVVSLQQQAWSTSTNHEETTPCLLEPGTWCEEELPLRQGRAHFECRLWGHCFCERPLWTDYCVVSSMQANDRLLLITLRAAMWWHLDLEQHRCSH